MRHRHRKRRGSATCEGLQGRRILQVVFHANGNCLLPLAGKSPHALCSPLVRQGSPKKCDVVYLTNEMSAIELVTSNWNAPYLAVLQDGTLTKLPVAVSISHT